MLIGRDERPPSQTEFRMVERVDFYGDGDRISSSDSGRAASIAGALRLNEQFKDVAARVTSSVVSIQAESSWRDFPRAWLQGREEDGVREMPRESVGSGVVISPQGYIVTNHHLVDGASVLRVTFSDKREFEAELVGADRSTDLAILRIDMNPDTEVSVVTLGDSDKVQAGEWVLAIGNPLQLTSTVTAGIVSALGRRVNVIEDEFNIEDFIQTDAAINPGNSGGALVNLRGELVGINTAIATESGYYEGYGFAIPVNLATRVAKDLIAYGEVRRGYLGVQLQSVDARRARALGLDIIEGVFLVDVRRGSAADRGGLRAGDVVLSVAGRPVNESNAMQSAIALYRPGDRVAVNLWRDGRTEQVEVELMGRDDPAVDDWLASLGRGRRILEPDQGTHFRMEQWGLVLREIQAQERQSFDVEQGVYLVDVVSGSAAATAEIPRGVVVERINGEGLASIEDALRLLSRSDGQVKLSVVLQKGHEGEFILSLPRQ